jgi:acyl carrier protein
MLEQLKEWIVQYVEVQPEEITLSSRFIEDLQMNSYDFMSLLGEMEEALDVTIDETEILNLQTVGDAVTYLETLKSAE